ncbi:DUF5683 domain-containing protein [Tenacibaculum jejuense]|uniref:DUF5683 domain-containing protein n=1 Tax=Tenacibaculum jejuense TaxID=584609 RepID=A0A238U9Z4_9FLAO|nr:DUF5683 domain-containing protein [Tenacibaculum jejuense]SNR15220.1 conserved protein of unknown function [Tenacibaculum jejuense]
MKKLYYIILFFVCIHTYAQKDSTKVQQVSQLQLRSPKVQYNPLSPSKAAFYSAILPGAGQIYNNRYWWQLPLIYGGMATSIYFFIDNSNEYDRFRTAFRQRSAGLQDEFTLADGTQIISTAGLESAQRQLRQNRDLSLLTTVLIYVLQIVEASVTAHLIQFDDSDDLSLSPTAIPSRDAYDASPKVGLTLKYTF